MKTTFMKTASFLLVIVILALSLVSCGGKGEIRNAYKAVLAEIKDALYDPDSLIMESAEGVYQEGETYIYFKLTYNAKNRLGGYVGADTYYYLYNMETGKVYEGGSTNFGLLKFLYDNQKDGTSSSEDTYYYLKIE